MDPPARLELGVAVMLVVSALGLEREDQKPKVFLGCTAKFRPVWPM